MQITVIFFLIIFDRWNEKRCVYQKKSRCAVLHSTSFGFLFKKTARICMKKIRKSLSKSWFVAY